MIKIFYDENGKILGSTEAITPNLLEITNEEWQDITEKPDKYFVQNNVLCVNPNYEAEKAQKERERIAMLKMTPRDFLLAITSMGIDWADIKSLMAQNPQVEIELNYCQYVYRGNPLLDDLCGNFGVTPEQLDELFITKGGGFCVG